ncbi:hypothetical protein N7454_005515 [Penicillium verhagenii]|nr:hypothetical protein N7454_005515 [Penicillium verhagenii]
MEASAGELSTEATSLWQFPSSSPPIPTSDDIELFVAGTFRSPYNPIQVPITTTWARLKEVSAGKFLTSSMKAYFHPSTFFISPLSLGEITGIFREQNFDYKNRFRRVQLSSSSKHPC